LWTLWRTTVHQRVQRLSSLGLGERAPMVSARPIHRSCTRTCGNFCQQTHKFCVCGTCVHFWGTRACGNVHDGCRREQALPLKGFTTSSPTRCSSSVSCLLSVRAQCWAYGACYTPSCSVSPAALEHSAPWQGIRSNDGEVDITCIHSIIGYLFSTCCCAMHSLFLPPVLAVMVMNIRLKRAHENHRATKRRLELVNQVGG